MGIALIAVDPPPFVKRANVEKKAPQTILASLYTARSLTGNAIYENKTF